VNRRFTKSGVVCQAEITAKPMTRAGILMKHG
jgi:hypothetical protein